MKNVKRSPMVWGFLAICVFALMLFAARADPAAGGQAAQASLPANADEVLIAQLRQSLGNDRLSQEDRQSLQSKLDAAERQAAQRGTNVSRPGPKGPQVPPVAVQPILANVDSTESIVAGSDGLVHDWEATIINFWQGDWQGKAVQVLAGASAQVPEQGGVMVFRWQTNGLLEKQWVNAPLGRGALTILQRQDGRLVCSETSGATLYFDLTSLSFSD